MPERFAKIESSSLRERSLEERLKAYPGLKAKIEAMLSIIENSGGDVEKAAEAERRMIEEWRQMGNEVLHRWARRQQQKKEEEHNAQPGVNRQEKKALLVQGAGKNRPRGGGLHPRTEGPEIRPFSPSAEVHGRGCWEALPRALTDLGAEDPIAGAAAKRRED